MWPSTTGRARVRPAGRRSARPVLALDAGVERAELIRIYVAANVEHPCRRLCSSTVLARVDRAFALGDPPDYEPPTEASVAARAVRSGRDPMYDLLLERDGHELLFAPAANYVDCDYRAALTMPRQPCTVVSLGDGGAHCCCSICDGSYPTYLLTHWGRDRSCEERLALEFAVHRYTIRRSASVTSICSRAPPVRAEPTGRSRTALRRRGGGPASARATPDRHARSAAV
jgi:hypothetical protein